MDSLSIFKTNILILGLSDHLKPMGYLRQYKVNVCFICCTLLDSHYYKQTRFL